MCLQLRNKRDLKTIAELRAMDDKSEGGMYSELRKSSYQIEFVQQLRPGWAVIKRSDRPEPFPIVLHLEEVARLPPVAPANARIESSLIPSQPGESAETPSAGNPTTLIEHDLRPLAGFAVEVLDFLQATASAQDLNGGPVSHKLLADQLLYKLQPALFKFKLSEKASISFGIITIPRCLIETLFGNFFHRFGFLGTLGEDHDRSLSHWLSLSSPFINPLKFSVCC